MIVENCRTFTFFAILLITLSYSSCGRRDSGAVERRLGELLAAKDYFRLRTSFDADSGKISPEKSLYFAAFINNAFNKTDASIYDINTLLHSYGSRLSDSLKTTLLMVLEDNYFKSFRYAEAAGTNHELMTHYSKELVKMQGREETSNDSIIRNALRGLPAQTVQIDSNTTIPWRYDTLGLIEVPIIRAKTSYPAIFDTRANISSINTSYAKKLHIRMLDAKIVVSSGATGNKFTCDLGIADSLYLGGILVRNTVFIVMPDEVLTFSPVHFSLNIILGLPVIAQLKEIHVFQHKTMVIPKTPALSSLHNLFLDGQNPVVSVVTNKDTLPFLFDSGASSSDFFSTFYGKYKETILKTGEKRSVHTEGAGGQKEIAIYRLKNLSLRIGSSQATLKDADVHINPTNGVNETYYGNLGQDVISQFEEMILNFDTMFLDFR